MNTPITLPTVPEFGAVPEFGGSVAAQVMGHGTAWMIEPQIGLALWENLRSQGIELHRAQFEADPKTNEPTANAVLYLQSRRAPAFADGDLEPHANQADKSFFVTADGIALLSIDGPMTKQVAMSASGTSTVYLRRMVQLAGRDPDIKGVLMRIDSPGGSVAGTADLAKTVSDAALVKPVLMFAEDHMMSAAMWIGSQGTGIVATPTTHVGSIGTILVLNDLHRMAERLGIEPVVFATDDMKGAGAPGTEITPAQRAYFQSIITGMQTHFTEAVSQGRGMSTDAVKALGARIYKADAALENGLIDGTVGSYSEALAQITQLSKTWKPGQKWKPGQGLAKGRNLMADNTQHADDATLGARFRNFFMGEPAAAPPALAAPPAQALLAGQGTLSAAQSGILAACGALSISSAAQLHEMSADAKDRGDLRADLMAQVNQQAVRALGADAAGAACAGLEHFPSAVLIQKREAFRAHANAVMGITDTTGAARAAAHNPLPEAANLRGVPPAAGTTGTEAAPAGGAPAPKTAASAEYGDAVSIEQQARAEGRAYAEQQARLSSKQG